MTKEIMKNNHDFSITIIMREMCYVYEVLLLKGSAQLVSAAAKTMFRQPNYSL